MMDLRWNGRFFIWCVVCFSNGFWGSIILMCLIIFNLELGFISLLIFIIWWSDC